MSNFTATEQDAIRRDHRAMEGAGISMVDQLDEILDSINDGAIGITAVAADVDSLAKGGGHFTPDPDTTTGLTFGYRAGRFHNGLAVVSVAAGTLALSASLTNYVEVDRAGTVSSNTSGFTSGALPLFTVVTGASTISSTTSAKPLLVLIGTAGVVGSMLSTAAKTKSIEIPLGDLAATASFSLIVPAHAATVARVTFATKTAIATHASDTWTFGLVNKGPAGSGTTEVVDNVAANSTNSTGGSAITGYVKRDLTLNGTPGVDAALDVAAGDVLEFTATKAGSATTMAQCVLKVDLTFSG